MTDPSGLLRQLREVPREIVPALLVALAARLLDAPNNGNGQPEAVPETDRLLTPEEAAVLLNTTHRWLYRHAKRLPFTRRLSRKALRFSEAGLKKWLAAKKP